ncbi:DUF4430 domain-containing protein [Scatolibacter rhodanostii]|uniref:DUF4430 domain-containing protein n=1 Tax=Scatolibacter rhodanostii TaxID=2014781 RepID=UPI000C07C3C3|nr:DUF4430 domain-containing protein [Scatolibacter rhodanostii]
MKKHSHILRYLSTAFFALLLTIGLAGCQNQQTASTKPDSSSVSSSVSLASEKANEAAKINLDFRVVGKDGKEETFAITSEKTNLKEILDEQNLIEGSDSSYGFFVTTVNGETADDANQEWWCLTKNGELWNYGVSDTEVADGDKFEFTLTVGYDQ